MQVIDLHLYLKCHSSAGVFSNIASKNQLPGLSVSGTLVKNGLTTSIEPVSWKVTDSKRDNEKRTKKTCANETDTGLSS